MILTVRDLTVRSDPPLSLTRKNMPDASAASMTTSSNIINALNKTAPDITGIPANKQSQSIHMKARSDTKTLATTDAN